MTDNYIIGHDGAALSGELVTFHIYTLYRPLKLRLEELERIHAELKAAYEDLEERCEKLQRIIDEME
jgi:hypothetical protein